MSVELDFIPTFPQKHAEAIAKIRKILDEGKMFVYICMESFYDYNSTRVECSHVCQSKEEALAWVAQVPEHGWGNRYIMERELK